MYLFPCFSIESVFDSIPKPTLLLFILIKYYMLLYLIGFSNSICVITCTYVIMCHSNSIYVLKIQMAAPDDNLNDDIMANIINAGTNADVDDTSQYFADYEDILISRWLKINKLSRKKILARYIRLSIISYRCMRTYICC